MKKHIILTILLLMILCVLLAGCLPDNDQVKNSIKSIYIHEASPNSFSIDEPLNLSDVKLVVEYKDGRIEIIPVSEAMISNEDRTKFSTVGSGITVLIHYGGRSVPYSFEVLETRQEKNIMWILKATAVQKSNHYMSALLKLLPCLKGRDIPLWAGIPIRISWASLA